MGAFLFGWSPPAVATRILHYTTPRNFCQEFFQEKIKKYFSQKKWGLSIDKPLRKV